MAATNRNRDNPMNQWLNYDDESSGTDGVTTTRHGMMHVAAIVAQYDVHQHVHAADDKVFVALNADDDATAFRLLQKLKRTYGDRYVGLWTYSNDDTTIHIDARAVNDASE
jgi:hypothetical protein